MSKFSAICLIAIIVGLGVGSCNSSSEQIEYELPSSALVKSFYLSADENVLDNLDNVFFSIDLANGNIFNADSMPYGTPINKLVPVITTGGASAIELVVTRPGKSDTTYNYMENSTDSIDFSNGAVQLKIQSINETVTKIYNINVNVHKVKSDSLSWGSVAFTQLPTNLADVTAQHSLKHEGKAYCLTTDDDDYCMSVCDNPESKAWQSRKLDIDFDANVESFRATTDAFYLLDRYGALYKSEDLGDTWVSTGERYDYLIGGYDDKLLATVNEGGKWFVCRTDGIKTEAPEDFPVTGASMPIEYTFPMSSARQLTIVGGCLASGKFTGHSWGYDGTNWARLSNVPLPKGLEGVSLTPYFTFEENEYWVATKEAIFIVTGGHDYYGECNKTSYISYNYGVTWRQAPDLLQLPEEVPAVWGAQTLVFSSRFGSRASTAITSWECPYIYMFGGENEDGYINKQVWRGVINRLSFKPLQ